MKDMNGFDRAKQWVTPFTVDFAIASTVNSADFAADVDELQFVATQNCFVVLGDDTTIAKAKDTRTVAFTSGGTHEVLVGDTLTGATSAATAVVTNITLASGTWAGGDAAGTFTLRTQTGTFQSETLNEGANTNVCTIAANSALSGADNYVKSGEVYHMASPNAFTRIAVIRDSADGILYVTQLKP